MSTTPAGFRRRGLNVRTQSSGKTVPNKFVKDYVSQRLNAMGERKYFWKSTDGTPEAPSYSSTTVNGLFRIGDGTGVNERIGKKISPTSLEVHLNAYRGSFDSMLRVIFVRWNVAAPALSTVSVLEGTNDGNSNFITAPYVLDKSKRKRFSVLYDKTVLLDDAKQNGAHLKFNVKVNAKPILYEGDLLSSTATGQIFMIMLTDNSLGNAPSVYYDIVGRYRDL